MHSNMIPLTGMDIIEFTPAELLGHTPKPTFFIRVPTFAMRDKMAAILFQRGHIPATLAQSRGILIDALYELAGPEGEAQADDDATFLESYWTRAQVHEEITEGWQIREAQRLFDIAHGVPPDKVPQEPMPPAPYSMREQARQARITMFVLENSETFRTYQARFLAQQEEEDEAVMRLFIDHWTGCIVRLGDEPIDEIKAERDELDRLTLPCIEALRGWLNEQGAKQAWDAIKVKVRSQFGNPGGLEKNLDSPSDMNSNLTGSPIQSDALASSGGSSTALSIDRIPGLGSAAISGASRNSRSGSKGKPRTARQKNGRTAKRSSSSPKG